MANLNLQSLRTRIGKVCVAITGTSAEEMLEKATHAIKETPFIEFRLDYLPKPLLALPALKTFLAEHGAVTAIGTCRRTEHGGRFGGSPTALLDVLLQAAGSGFHLVDIELESAEALKPKDFTRLREAGVPLIVSHHDFQATGDLDAIYERARGFEPDFVKIVPMARALTDNVTMMRFIERISDRANIVGMCMGDAGIISRVLGLRAGSAFTFAAASAGEETGPGQIAARTLVETYRIEEVDAATKVYGVAGNPLRHSLSPIMMNTAFRRETVNAVYLALQTDDVKDLVALIGQIPVQGVSITMPHKQAILPYLEQTDPLSKKIGACNTVLRAPDGKLYGFNTDVAGIVAPLEKRMPLKGAKVLVMGAGGSARAAAFGLINRGAEVFILARNVEAGAKLAKQAGAKSLKREALGKTNFDVILNATPIGMLGHEGEPMLSEAELRAKLVFDLVYNPVDTPLIRMARAAAIPVITGVEMFVQQGARQFEIWTGKPAPEEEMLRVVLHALRQSREAPGEAPAPGSGVGLPQASAQVPQAASPASHHLSPVPRHVSPVPHHEGIAETVPPEPVSTRPKAKTTTKAVRSK